MSSIESSKRYGTVTTKSKGLTTTEEEEGTASVARIAQEMFMSLDNEDLHQEDGESIDLEKLDEQHIIRPLHVP